MVYAGTRGKIACAALCVGAIYVERVRGRKGCEKEKKGFYGEKKGCREKGECRTPEGSVFRLFVSVVIAERTVGEEGSREESRVQQSHIED